MAVKEGWGRAAPDHSALRGSVGARPAEYLRAALPRWGQPAAVGYPAMRWANWYPGAGGASLTSGCGVGGIAHRGRARAGRVG